VEKKWIDREGTGKAVQELEDPIPRLTRQRFSGHFDRRDERSKVIGTCSRFWVGV